MNVTSLINSNSCRICLTNPGNISIHEVRGDFTISAIIMMLSNVNIDPNDNLPDSICQSCELKVETAYQLKQEVERSDMHLRDLFSQAQPQVIDPNYYKIDVINSSGVQEEIILPEYYEIREVNMQQEVQNEEECFVISDSDVDEQQEETEEIMLEINHDVHEKPPDYVNSHHGVTILDEQHVQVKHIHCIEDEIEDSDDTRLIKRHYIKRCKTNSGNS